MALTRFTGTTPLPGETVTVTITDQLDTVDLYEDDAGTFLGNPFTSDVVTGEYQFWADGVLTDVVDAT
jgi:hypothetical protein